MRPVRLLALALGCLLAPPAAAQTVVDLDLGSAAELLSQHRMGRAIGFLKVLATNYRQSTNIRIQSRKHKTELAILARALRTDFDGSGTGYVRGPNIWRVYNDVGGRVFLAASLLDRKAVLLATDLDYLKGMLAYEILQLIQQGDMSISQGKRHAQLLHIEMQVIEDEYGERSISFFGHGEKHQLVGKLIVIEPPDFCWD
ncbi:MAG: hypothetical protein JXR96_07990 [Deltaproteobacteria bacterium]|nr:hypothetical protein [Deltaproteobacteria bacterium]